MNPLGLLSIGGKVAAGLTFLGGAAGSNPRATGLTSIALGLLGVFGASPGSVKAFLTTTGETILALAELIP